MNMNVSAKGRSFLIAHEGMVKKAYRCPAGIWTIGTGLTAASGVIKPKAGMTITEEENSRLLNIALTRNYLPRVEKALKNTTSQNAIDGGTSFDYNTGAILKASWVGKYLKGDETGARIALSAWNKGGGKVLKGLVRRRAEEADIILLGKYPAWVHVTALSPTVESSDFAVFVVSVTEGESEEICAAFSKLGYDVGRIRGMIARKAVEEFQRAHDLTVDGKIGRATIATLQREIDAKAKSGKAAAASAGGVGVAGGSEVAGSTLDPSIVSDVATGNLVWIGAGVTLLAVAYAGYLAWTYRDLIAARLNDKMPRTAAYLRSF